MTNEEKHEIFLIIDNKKYKFEEGIECNCTTCELNNIDNQCELVFGYEGCIYGHCFKEVK